MPKATFASHLLMHSTNTSENHGGRETDSFDESKKNAGQPQKNYEQDSNMKFAQKRGKEQLKRLQAQNESEKVTDESEKIEQGREAAERVREKELATVEKEKAARGESTQKKDDTSESGQSDAKTGANQNQKDMGQQSKSKDQKEDQGAQETVQQGKQQDKQSSQDSAQKSDTKQTESKQSQVDAQKSDNEKADDKQEAGSEKQKSGSPPQPEGKKQQGELTVDNPGASAGNNLEGDDKAKGTSSKPSTTTQPRTELTGGKKTEELSDDGKENREKGERQIEARRMPEDVEDKQGKEDKRNQREISRRNLPEPAINQSQNRALHEEIARRKSGRTPFEQLDTFEQQSQGQPHSIITDEVANIEQARSRTRQEEMDWRSRNQDGLDTLHRIQARQETAFQDFQDRESQNRGGMLSGITHFASDKWNNLVHGNDHKKKSEEEQFWGKNEARVTGKRSTQATPPASPTTPTSGRRALADTNQNQRGQNVSPVQPAKKGWWIFGNLQHFAPDWRQDGQQRFIDTLTDDELSMMSL